MFALTRHAADEGPPHRGVDTILEREVVLQEQLQLGCAAALRGKRFKKSGVLGLPGRVRPDQQAFWPPLGFMTNVPVPVPHV